MEFSLVWYCTVNIFFEVSRVRVRAGTLARVDIYLYFMGVGIWVLAGRFRLGFNSEIII